MLAMCVGALFSCSDEREDLSVKMMDSLKITAYVLNSDPEGKGYWKYDGTHEHKNRGYWVSDDGKEYTVTLVDATFQNGETLTAEDAVFSYNLAIANPKYGYVTSMIDKIEAKDPKTVVLTLKYPYAAIAHTFFTIKNHKSKRI